MRIYALDQLVATAALLGKSVAHLSKEQAHSLRVSFLQAQLRERRKLELRKHTIANAEAALASACATVASARTELARLEAAREAERAASRRASRAPTLPPAKGTTSRPSVTRSPAFFAS